MGILNILCAWRNSFMRRKFIVGASVPTMAASSKAHFEIVSEFDVTVGHSVFIINVQRFSVPPFSASLYPWSANK